MFSELKNGQNEFFNKLQHSGLDSLIAAAGKQHAPRLWPDWRAKLRPVAAKYVHPTDLEDRMPGNEAPDAVSSSASSFDIPRLSQSDIKDVSAARAAAIAKLQDKIKRKKHRTEKESSSACEGTKYMNQEAQIKSPNLAAGLPSKALPIRPTSGCPQKPIQHEHVPPPVKSAPERKLASLQVRRPLEAGPGKSSEMFKETPSAQQQNHKRQIQQAQQ